jgi:hypothetical protein
VAQAIEAKVAPPQSGDGYGLTLTWKILEGDFEGRQLWQYITYLHSNETAQAIGRKTIKDICTALDINEAVQDASVFLFKPARLSVGIQKDKQGVYPDRNKVSRVTPLVAATETSPKPTSSGGKTDKPEATKPAPRTQGAPRPGPGGTAPWHKQK